MGLGPDVGATNRRSHQLLSSLSFSASVTLIVGLSAPAALPSTRFHGVKCVAFSQWLNPSFCCCVPHLCFPPRVGRNASCTPEARHDPGPPHVNPRGDSRLGYSMHAVFGRSQIRQSDLYCDHDRHPGPPSQLTPWGVQNSDRGLINYASPPAARSCFRVPRRPKERW